MTDAITNQGRMAQSARVVRSPMGKADQSAGTVPAGVSVDNPGAAPVAVTPGRQGDVLSLSNVTQRIKDAPGFDRVKVDAIKEAIHNGQYPLNPHRIAESFVALERMFSD